MDLLGSLSHSLPQTSFNLTMSSQPRIAIVTGASSGIGRVSSIALFKAGWTVFLSGRREDQLDETKRLMEKAVDETSRVEGQEAISFAGDMTRQEDVNALFEQVNKRFGEFELEGAVVCKSLRVC